MSTGHRKASDHELILGKLSYVVFTIIQFRYFINCHSKYIFSPFHSTAQGSAAAAAAQCLGTW